jgi:hypothetical protein
MEFRMDVKDLKKKFPNASASFLKANAKFPNASESTLRANATIVENRSDGVRANNPQPVKGNTLERVAPREDSSRAVPLQRFRITFTVYAARPADYDGYDIKHLQDWCVKAALIPDDNWRILEGSVISRKAHSKADERTEIEVTPL